MKTILLLTIFLIPLLGVNNSFGYEQIKIIFFILSTSLIGFIWLFQKPQMKWSSIKITSLVFILILFITSALGIDFKLSFFGQEPYFQGLVLYAYLFLFSLLVSSVAITLEHVALVLTGSATIVSLVAIQDWVLLNVFNEPVQTYAGRVVSTFGQPNFYAGFLLLTLPFSYYLFKNPQKKLNYFGWGSGLISIAGIFVSYSRSTILMTLLLLALGLIAELKIKFKIGLVVLGVVLISILIALSLSSGIVGSEISQPILTRNPDLTWESIEKRVYIWPVAFKIIQQRPFLGYGLENIGPAFSNYFQKNKHLLFEENLKISPILISLKELIINRSHSYILDLLLFSGIFGLLAWVSLVILLLKKLRQNTKNPTIVGKNVLMVALIIYLVWIQFQNQSIVHLMYFWLLVGLVDKNWGLDKRGGERFVIELMSSLNQKGVAHILGLLLLVVGLGAGVYLVKQQTNLFSRAAPSAPISMSCSSANLNCPAGYKCQLQACTLRKCPVSAPNCNTCTGKCVVPVRSKPTSTPIPKF